MKEFLPGMYMHHEMVDGKGYPQGLKGDEIPLMGLIVAVADTFDAMTTDRPYQRAMKFEEAVERIQSFVGTRYDERVVAAFSAACQEGQIRPGSVKLKRQVATEPIPSTSPQLLVPPSYSQFKHSFDPSVTSQTSSTPRSLRDVCAWPPRCRGASDRVQARPIETIIEQFLHRDGLHVP